MEHGHMSELRVWTICVQVLNIGVMYTKNFVLVCVYVLLMHAFPRADECPPSTVYKMYSVSHEGP